MSGNFRFELNKAGVRELMLSPEAQAVCAKYAGRIESAAGSGYTTTTRRGINRVHVRVAPDTREAVHDNYKNNTLLKAMKGAQR